VIRDIVCIAATISLGVGLMHWCFATLVRWYMDDDYDEYLNLTRKLGGRAILVGLPVFVWCLLTEASHA
jgi:hypothetical protein